MPQLAMNNAGLRTIHSLDFKPDREGWHQVALTVMPEKNEKSLGTNVIIIGFETIFQ